MKRIIATLALTCALSVPVIAGEIPTCGCKSIKDKTPSAPAPVTQEMPAVDSTSAFSETESSVLLTVILTLISLVDG